jgi:DNA-binding MarR family transcriptional regulator
MSRDIELLTEIRDLLQVIAEPALAQRDAKRRSSLRAVVGDSEKRAKAVGLMDGSRSQSAIAKEVGLDPSRVSRLVKALAAAGLISDDEKHPMLMIRVPATFFDENSDDE